MSEKQRFKFLEHTADAYIAAYGNTMEEAFENAALATIEVMTDTGKVKPEVEERVEIEAEDRHDFTERLVEIKVPTLVIGGELDKFYDIRQMAEGISGARLVLYKNTGHTAMMKRRFGEDILAFLNEDTD